MTVESAVRQASTLHDVGDANPVVAPLAKECAGRVENRLSVHRRLIARHSHRCLQCRMRLILYMMVVINTMRATERGYTNRKPAACYRGTMAKRRRRPGR